jgi:hypothetical protein
MRKHQRHLKLADLLSAGLRRDPSQRIGIQDMRARILDYAKDQEGATSWPIRP